MADDASRSDLNLKNAIPAAIRIRRMSGSRRILHPLAVYHESIFVGARLQFNISGPLTVALGQSGGRLPAIETASDSDTSRLGRSKTESNRPAAGLFFFSLTRLLFPGERFFRFGRLRLDFSHRRALPGTGFGCSRLICNTFRRGNGIASLLRCRLGSHGKKSQ